MTLIRLLGKYKQRLESAESDYGQIIKLDEEIESLIRQERVLIAIKEKGYTDHSHFTAEHEESVSKLTKLQAARTELANTLTRYQINQPLCPEYP